MRKYGVTLVRSTVMSAALSALSAQDAQRLFSERLEFEPDQFKPKRTMDTYHIVDIVEEPKSDGK